MTPAELTHLRALRGKIEERMGAATPNLWTADGMLFAPLAIDPENPERGLCGMSLFPLHLDLDSCEVWYHDDIAEVHCFDGETIYLALLKALAAQWGITVKEAHDER